jgi:hypothetical protein
MVNNFLAKISGVSSERAFRFVEADKREVAAIAMVQGLLIVHGKKDMVMFNMSPTAARKLMWFLWSWHFKTCWCGLREIFTEWAINRAVRKVSKQSEARRHPVRA